MSKVLIVGLGGIGSLYERVCRNLFGEDNVDTVDLDPTKNPVFTEIPSEGNYDLGIICTPNYLHYQHIIELFKNDKCDQVLVEKPGVVNYNDWIKLKDVYGDKLIMTKNNCYRSNFLMYADVHTIESVDMYWVSRDRVPGAGTWFTNQSKSLGGVSVDLMPHLLNIAFDIVQYHPQTSSQLEILNAIRQQKYSLDDIKETGYGVIDRNGVYDVDDQCVVQLKVNNVIINAVAAWKSDIETDTIKCVIKLKDGELIEENLGLCPETAYSDMISHIIEMPYLYSDWHTHYDNTVHAIFSSFIDTEFDFNNYIKDLKS